jgi:hypothetical protein
MVKPVVIFCLIGFGLPACHPIGPISDSFSAAPPQGVVGLVIPQIAPSVGEQVEADLALIKMVAFRLMPGSVMMTPHQLDGYGSNHPYGWRDPGQVTVDLNFERIHDQSDFVAYVFGCGREFMREDGGRRSYHITPVGWLDLGWTLVKVGDQEQQPIATDFARPLHMNQEVFVLRPTVAPEDIYPTGPWWSADSLDRHLVALTARIPTFEWASGRLLAPRLVPELGFDADEVPGDVVYIVFPPELRLNGFSGSPILVRDGDSWIAVGMLASGISKARVGRRDYTLGIGVRPGLGVLEGEDQPFP